MSAIKQYSLEERQFSIAEVRLHFCLLSTLFLDVQTEFNWSYLSSESKEFRGVLGFFIDSYTKVQLLHWSRIFFFIIIFFFIFRLTHSLNHSRLVSLRLLLVLTLPLNWTLDSGDDQHGVLLSYTGTETGFLLKEWPWQFHMLIQNIFTCTYSTQKPKKKKQQTSLGT